MLPSQPPINIQTCLKIGSIVCLSGENISAFVTPTTGICIAMKTMYNFNIFASGCGIARHHFRTMVVSSHQNQTLQNSIVRLFAYFNYFYAFAILEPIHLFGRENAPTSDRYIATGSNVFFHLIRVFKENKILRIVVSLKAMTVINFFIKKSSFYSKV